MPIRARLEWLIGAFYTDENTTWPQNVLAADPSTGALAGSLLSFSFGPTKYEEYAAFTDVTFHVTDRFDVQFGGRESRNSQTHDEKGIDPLFGDGSEHVSPTIRTSADAFTYLVTPRFTLSPNLMTYARFASGYRAGGPNQLSAIGFPASFAPEKTQNYEIGLKGNARERLLSFDASLYYIDWQDLQIFVVDSVSGFQYTTNISRARSQGVELSLESRPRADLTIAAWVAWNDAVLTEGLPPGAAYGFSGDRLPNSSPFSGNISVDKEFTLTGSVGGFFGAALRYVGDRRGQFMGSAQRQYFPPYSQTDLHAGVRYNTWAVDIFLNNVANKRGVLSGGLGNQNPIAFQMIQPRTVGVNISNSF